MQLHELQRGLQIEIKDELARVDMPTGLDALVDLTISCEKKREEKKDSLQSIYLHIGTSPSISLAKPMQANLIHQGLTPEEKEQCRQRHLCLYCSELGVIHSPHFPLILGISRLTLQEPIIHWRKQKVTFPSEFH